MGNAVRYRPPTRRKNPFGKVILIILILALLGVGGYYAYGYISAIDFTPAQTEQEEVIIIFEEEDEPEPVVEEEVETPPEGELPPEEEIVEEQPPIEDTVVQDDVDETENTDIGDTAQEVGNEEVAD